MRRMLRVATTVGLLASTLAGPASAASPILERFHDTVDETFPENLCGIDVMTHVEGVVNGKLALARVGEPRFQAAVSVTVTSENTDDDVLVTRVAGLNAKDLLVIDNEDGTVTATYTFRGLAERMTTGPGRAITMDVGVITFTTRFDASTGEAISDSTDFVAGPHPEADSGFELFCEVVEDVLG